MNWKAPPIHLLARQRWREGIQAMTQGTGTTHLSLDPSRPLDGMTCHSCSFQRGRLPFMTCSQEKNMSVRVYPTHLLTCVNGVKTAWLMVRFWELRTPIAWVIQPMTWASPPLTPTWDVCKSLRRVRGPKTRYPRSIIFGCPGGHHQALLGSPTLQANSGRWSTKWRRQQAQRWDKELGCPLSPSEFLGLSASSVTFHGFHGTSKFPPVTSRVIESYVLHSDSAASYQLSRLVKKVFSETENHL